MLTKRILLVSLAVVAVAVGGLIYIAARPSLEERVGADYAESVSVDGFRKAKSSVRAEDTVAIYVGASTADPRNVVRAPDVSLAPPSAELPNADPLRENLLEGVSTRQIDGLTCRVGVARLRQGKFQEGLGLTADETRQVKAGQMTVLWITVGCRRPLAPTGA